MFFNTSEHMHKNVFHFRVNTSYCKLSNLSAHILNKNPTSFRKAINSKKDYKPHKLKTSLYEKYSFNYFSSISQ